MALLSFRQSFLIAHFHLTPDDAAHGSEKDCTDRASLASDACARAEIPKAAKRWTVAAGRPTCRVGGRL